MCEQIEQQLLECSDETERERIAAELIEILDRDSSIRRRFCDEVFMPFYDENKIQVLTKLLRYTDYSQDWLLYLSANVLLHSLCHIVYKQSIAGHFFKRIVSIPDDLIMFLLSDVKDERVLDSLHDDIMIQMGHCQLERQLTLLKAVHTSSLRLQGSRKYFFSSVVDTSEQNQDLYRTALSQGDFPLDLNILMHLALFDILREQYAQSLRQIIDMAKSSEIASWYANHYATLYY